MEVRAAEDVGCSQFVRKQPMEFRSSKEYAVKFQDMAWTMHLPQAGELGAKPDVVDASSFYPRLRLPSWPICPRWLAPQILDSSPPLNDHMCTNNRHSLAVPAYKMHCNPKLLRSAKLCHHQQLHHAATPALQWEKQQKEPHAVKVRPHEAHWMWWQADQEVHCNQSGKSEEHSSENCRPFCRLDYCPHP